MKMFQQAITNILGTNEKVKSFNKEIECPSKEIEDIKKNQMVILELKNTIIKIENSVDNLSRFEGTEEIISVLEDKAISITQWEQERESRFFKKNRNRALGTCGTITKDLTCM